MNFLLKRKMRLFCVSNVMVSFVCTGFLGTAYCNNNVLQNVDVPKEEAVALQDEIVPLSLEKESNEEVKQTVESSTTKPKTTKTTTKKTSSKKTVTSSVVTKKEVKSSVTYTPAKYNSVTGSAIVEYAKKYLGLRYKSGGFSLTSGTDCSGFTKLIYKEFGITLSRVVSGQIKQGSYVSKSDLQKGDLVFYSKGGKTATHVAIYIGGGQVIHESNPKDGVKYSSVNMMHYITGRRVINDTANKIAAEKTNNQQENTTTQTTEATNTNTVDNNVSTTTTTVVEEPRNNEEVVNNNTNAVVSSETTNTSNSQPEAPANNSTSDVVVESKPIEEPSSNTNTSNEETTE